MIEIQQLIIKAKVNSGDSEEQNLVPAIEAIVESYVKSVIIRFLLEITTPPLISI